MLYSSLLALAPLIPVVSFAGVYIFPTSSLSSWAAKYATPLTADTEELRTPLLWCFSLALLPYLFTRWLIPGIATLTEKRGLYGIDLNKKGQEDAGRIIPESLGIVPGVVYVVFVIMFQLFYIHTAHQTTLVEYNAALTSITFMIFLGFADDVLDLRWRYKLLLPTVASLPLLVAYSGPTNVVLPPPLGTWIGKSLELGLLYKLYMGMLAVFCSNSINILAGINGLEAGQSLIIACSVLVHNLVELSSEGRDYHLLSIFFVVPFVATTLGLLQHNWFPSRVFVGDTYTYFAGMTFAVVGILGHFSKTLLLLFLPQVINFLYSLPQLLQFIPCPRHRLPAYNSNTRRLHAVKNHLTLLNLILQITGPLSERSLCIVALAFQLTCSGFAFFIRYVVAPYLYE
eukprot:gb/GECH01014244.1/.p1 GENE.gb/GECH01014244.1/~~gb/GECH01014244.1/.p1  ORF type:complete len:400 (+),score=46.40 gb/GECH01014244.1/:1-1200(+)